MSNGSLDVLIVGAGPTGLALAAQLREFGVEFRIVDRALDRVHESRALAVQARSLEVLQSLGLGQILVERGNPSARLMIHFERAPVTEVVLADFGATDTRFPFILFVSQATTEAVLSEHLVNAGVCIERGVELIDCTPADDGIGCTLRHSDGREEHVVTSHLVGCDGAHSTVRSQAGIAFEGDAYLQDFVLGDVEVDGPLKRNTLHSFPGASGVAMFFPLGSPTTWRVIAMPGTAAGGIRASSAPTTGPLATSLPLQELQAVVDGATGSILRLRDPAWLAHFRLHHRQAEHYRAGRVFLAGDAAHIHSPVGGQGMNTGIQDAWNLGWKVALVALGAADPRLLDSYEAERWPVGRVLLRYTDRIFSVFVRAMSAGAIATWVRRHVAARVLPRVLGSHRLRSLAFHFISEFGIHYRKSFAVTEGTPKLASGPRAGDRLPDAQLMRAGETVHLQQTLSGPHLHLLLCGAWDIPARERANQLVEQYAPLLVMHEITWDDRPGALVDYSDTLLGNLGVRRGAAAQYVVRPDGYIGFRCAECELGSLTHFLSTWFTKRI